MCGPGHRAPRQKEAPGVATTRAVNSHQPQARERASIVAPAQPSPAAIAASELFTWQSA
jgi:hypothetical protein